MAEVPAEVTVKNETLDVKIVGPVPPPAEVKLPSVTTPEQDRTTLGQRRINLIWEFTQAAVTILITVAAIYCAVSKIDAQVLNFAFVAVISTYYARTNHTKVGGIGGGNSRETR